MSGVACIGDMTTGHGSYPPTMIVSGSSNVFVNGKPVACIGDSLMPHSNGKHTHGSVIAVGSSSVFVNGKPVASIGSKTSCGDTIKTGSSNVTSA